MTKASELKDKFQRLRRGRGGRRHTARLQQLHPLLWPAHLQR
jgi:hypothetical protein